MVFPPLPCPEARLSKGVANKRELHSFDMSSQFSVTNLAKISKASGLEHNVAPAPTPAPAPNMFLFIRNKLNAKKHKPAGNTDEESADDNDEESADDADDNDDSEPECPHCRNGCEHCNFGEASVEEQTPKATAMAKPEDDSDDGGDNDERLGGPLLSKAFESSLPQKGCEPCNFGEASVEEQTQKATAKAKPDDDSGEWNPWGTRVEAIAQMKVSFSDDCGESLTKAEASAVANEYWKGWKCHEGKKPGKGKSKTNHNDDYDMMKKHMIQMSEFCDKMDRRTRFLRDSVNDLELRLKRAEDELNWWRRHGQWR